MKLSSAPSGLFSVKDKLFVHWTISLVGLCSIQPNAVHAQSAADSSKLPVAPLSETSDATRVNLHQTLNPSDNKQAKVKDWNMERDCKCHGYQSGIGCWPFFLADKKSDTWLFTAQGTAFRVDNREQLTLQQGDIVILTKRQQVNVITEFGSLEIPNATIAMVQKTESGIVRIINVIGHDKTFAIRGTENIHPITVKGGEEVCTTASGSNDIQDDELLPTDEVQRQRVSKSVNNGWRTIVSSFETLKMADHVLPCCNYPGAWIRARQRVEKAMEFIELETGRTTLLNK